MPTNIVALLVPILYTLARLIVFCISIFSAITPDNLIIASGKSSKSKSKRLTKINELRSIYPLNSIIFTVFKRTHEQTIKVAFKNSNSVRYFDLERMDKRKVSVVV